MSEEELKALAVATSQAILAIDDPKHGEPEEMLGRL